jgi:4-hydroxyphenylpyruvate dioxygenase-like putative hemolysin
MDGFVATKLDEFERGKISRRRLIETLTLAATTAYAAEGASAQKADPKLKIALINHISYTVPNFRQAGDWFSKVFNLEQANFKDNELAVPFGKMGEQPYGVTAKDVPLTFIICRTRTQPNARYVDRPKPEAVIDHVAFTVADFNRERAKADLIAMGVKNVRDGGPYSLHMDDPFGYDIQISGLENNALTDG